MKIVIECNIEPVPDKVLAQVKMQLQDRIYPQNGVLISDGNGNILAKWWVEGAAPEKVTLSEASHGTD